MARIRLAKWLYAVALLMMPLSYALKDIFGLMDITWVDPTLILGVIIFLLMGFPIKEKSSLWILAVAFLSAFIGAFFLGASATRDKSAYYVYYVEPVRLTLEIIWFWVSIRFLRLDRSYVLRWLTVCVAWELFVACYLYCAFYDLVPVPDSVRLYLEIYKTRQALSWGNFEIYRMAGTFLESPLFGLFMFCCLVVFLLALSGSAVQDDGRLKSWMIFGVVCAFLGTVASLSDQMLIALAALASTFLFVQKSRKGIGRMFLWATLSFVLIIYAASALAAKSTNESVYSGDPSGSSISERAFHAKYGLHLFVIQPASVVVGIGPGRYGDYAVRTGFFPSSVTPQITLVEWVVEYGLLGLFFIGLWLFNIGSRAVLGYGIVGAGVLLSLLLANMFQANWLWEAWFLALAFLYSSVPETGPRGVLT